MFELAFNKKNNLKICKCYALLISAYNVNCYSFRWRKDLKMYFYLTCEHRKKVNNISTIFRLHTLHLNICHRKNKKLTKLLQTCSGVIFLSIFFSLFKQKIDILNDLNKGNNDFMLNNKLIKFCYLHK